MTPDRALIEQNIALLEKDDCVVMSAHCWINTDTSLQERLTKSIHNFYLLEQEPANTKSYYSPNTTNPVISHHELVDLCINHTPTFTWY